MTPFILNFLIQNAMILATRDVAESYLASLQARKHFDTYSTKKTQETALHLAANPVIFNIWIHSLYVVKVSSEIGLLTVMISPMLRDSRGLTAKKWHGPIQTAPLGNPKASSKLLRPIRAHPIYGNQRGAYSFISCSKIKQSKRNASCWSEVAWLLDRGRNRSNGSSAIKSP